MDSKYARVLVVDDEVTARVTLAEVLRLEGYHVEMAENGAQAIDVLESQPPFDLMVLDLKMPGMDGLQLTEVVQETSPGTVIILLTAFGTLETAIQAIRRGAHDYLLKPCPIPQILESVREGLTKRQRDQHRQDLVQQLEKMMGELVAVERGEATVLPLSSQEHVLTVQDVELNRDRHVVSIAGRAIDLTPTEFKLLACMMERADQVCSPQDLVRSAQGYDTDPWGARAIVRVHIRRLRQKLEVDPIHPRYIVNVRGVGYMFPSRPEEGATEEIEN
ncbi:MAG: response regulator transcription factor [Anaerolineae bacterium]|nr:response regulator transcription factor [Anaerolineae bacterium]